MEVFGILLSVPVAFFLNAAVAGLAWRFVRPVARLRRLVMWASAIVLGATVVEWVAVASLGAVALRRSLGPAFYAGHLLLFIAGAPALACALTLRLRRMGWTRLLLIATACAAFALILVLLQYGVSEALYGVNGDDGPFSVPR
jgi:hypothetical protein